MIDHHTAMHLILLFASFLNLHVE